MGSSPRYPALGALATTPNMDPEELSEDDVFGAGEITHFSWKQLLDLLSCTECGRCQDQCPAWNTGKPLSPLTRPPPEYRPATSRRAFAAATWHTLS